MTATTCTSCRRDIAQTPEGWSDGVRANPTVCIASPTLAHTPRVTVQP